MMESYLKCEECAGNVIDKEAGILNRGNLGRLKNFLSRAAQGERLTVGFIGGSITQGFSATEPDQCYAARTVAWLRKVFPNTEFDYVNEIQNNNENNSENNNIKENISENSVGEAIGGANESGNENIGEEGVETENKNNDGNAVDNLSQMEQDANYIKSTIDFIKPIEGKITSGFGMRNPTTASVPKNHTGTDIAAETGTKILAATEGKVILSSTSGDYGKHLKIQTSDNDVVVVYAHCNNLYVNEGETIKQGQEIAEVGATGNATGPHLHFEVRYQSRYVDPQMILEL